MISQRYCFGVLFFALTLLCALIQGSTGLIVADEVRSAEETLTGPEKTRCTYRAKVWDVRQRRAVADMAVDKSYAEVTAEERDPSEPRCTLCEQDQVVIDPATLGIVGVDSISICWVYADRLRAALMEIHGSGEFELRTVRGYRPGRTRGPIVNGRRTLFSNHSFGTAVDINAEHNGLYVRCDITTTTEANALQRCRLKHGGPWDPGGNPRTTILRNGVVVRAMSGHLGWRWGGELPGRMKDFMHFSVTGE